MNVAGVMDIMLGLFLFILIGVWIPLWSWKLSVLTARVVATMIVLPGIGGSMAGMLAARKNFTS